MITEISISDFLQNKPEVPIIDVRSPKEFEKGHIPNAKNVALFSNEERAEIGTIYVQKSKEKAIEAGYKYVTPKLDFFIEESKKIAKNNTLAVHCWRGGMRSRSFAEHLSKNGFDEIYLIKGGYKAYRRYVLSFFEQDFNLKVLGGYTGSGKTLILHEIQKNGEQIIDLEKIAHHKGSAFGAIGETAQPTVEQFENNLFSEMQKLDSNKPIWIEDESHNIGKVKIPMPLYRQIRAKKVFFINIPKEKRTELLISEYSLYGNEKIAAALKNIGKKLGGQNLKEAQKKLAENNYYEVALLALKYYDKAYYKGVKEREQDNVFFINLPDTNHSRNAEAILSAVCN